MVETPLVERSIIVTYNYYIPVSLSKLNILKPQVFVLFTVYNQFHLPFLASYLALLLPFSVPSSLLPPLPFSRGYMAVTEDYVPEVMKGVAKGLVYLLTVGAFAGLMYLNVKDIGICGAVKAVWSL